MVVVDGKGIPLGSHVASASSAEITLLERTLAPIRINGRPPERVIGDKAYDSDPHRVRLALRNNIELIAPLRSNRRGRSLQDGRFLRRVRRRWRVERTISWYARFRRLVVRYERCQFMYEAFVHVASLMIVVRWS